MRVFALALSIALNIFMIGDAAAREAVPPRYLPSNTCDQGAIGGKILIGEYAYQLTDEVLSPKHLATEIRDRYGANASPVTWREIKALLKQSKERQRFIENLHIPLQANNFTCGNILIDSTGLQGSSAYLFIARHDGFEPRDWLVLDDVGHHAIDLGRWNHFGRALIKYPANLKKAAPNQNVENGESNSTWIVEAGNPNADDDSVFLCSLRSKGGPEEFRIVAYDDPKQGSFEITVHDDRLGPSVTRNFPMRISFDNENVQTINAQYVSEFGSLGGPIPNLDTFLEMFAHASKMDVAVKQVGQFSIPLKGSRSAVDRFRQCLGRSEPSQKTVESTPMPKEIAYGSREGMDATVISATGLNSGLAEIRIKHTRENAKKFCKGYVLDSSKKCIDETMASVKLEDRVLGNCETGEFTDPFGQRFRYEGRNHDPSVMGDVKIRSLKENSILNGSSASGALTNLRIFEALCPDRVKSDGLSTQ